MEARLVGVCILKIAERESSIPYSVNRQLFLEIGLVNSTTSPAVQALWSV